MKKAPKIQKETSSVVKWSRVEICPSYPTLNPQNPE